ncbi:MAG TPA: PBSX family phage terminase large subunit [Bdellovibrionota bacterium]|nr:PBSX family phage terminase large subunit [Bdellovibrionota bacterium]
MLQEVSAGDGVSAFIPPKRGRGRPRTNFNPKVRVKDGPGRPSKKFGKIPIKTTMVFAANKACDSQIIVNRGGARSSKSYSIMQCLIEDFFTIPHVKILILRKYSPSLRVSCKPLFYQVVNDYGLRDKVIEVKQDSNVFSPVKGMIHFSGLDDPEKIKSSDWNAIWCEECSEFNYEDFVNLQLRLSCPTYGSYRNKIYLSFNPINEHSWIKTKVIDGKSYDLTEIVSNYRMNPFLSADYRRTIEALQYQDYNFWRVFSEGEWGSLTNLIYSNWKRVDELNDGDEIFGLDFGFSSPSALVRVFVDGMVAGIEQKIYKTGLTNSDLIVEMNRVMTEDQKAKCPIYCDTEDPNRIEELRRENFWVFPAEKKVVPGIDYVRRHKLLVKSDSEDLIKEIGGYSYKTDRDGKVLEEPIRGFDHGMDALRYALFTHYSRMTKNIPGIKVLDWKDDRSRDSWDDDDD